MGNLKQNTDTIAGLTVCILSRSMLQILDNFQSILHGLVSLDSLDIDNRTNSAVIMLESRII